MIHALLKLAAALDDLGIDRAAIQVDAMAAKLANDDLKERPKNRGRPKSDSSIPSKSYLENPFEGIQGIKFPDDDGELTQDNPKNVKNFMEDEELLRADKKDLLEALATEVCLELQETPQIFNNSLTAFPHIELDFGSKSVRVSIGGHGKQVWVEADITVSGNNHNLKFPQLPNRISWADDQGFVETVAKTICDKLRQNS